VYPARTPLRVVRLGPTDFYGRLRDRFSLSDAPATRNEAAAPETFPAPGPDRPDDLRGLRLPPSE
jgi:NAD+ kinase